MIRNLTLALGLLSGATSFAQLAITDSLSSAQLATLLEGFNVSVTSVTINCAPQAMGEFSGTSEIPFPHGLLLTTGSADAAAGANLYGGTGTALGLGGDPDLDMLAMVPTTDACVIEFDCIPFGDTLLFNFAFASEEYPEFVGTFNDVFGILIDGPGFLVPVNAALLPDSSPVSINNINAGANAAYFTDNENPPGVNVIYDGFTTGLTAFAVVQPGSTYHFKVAIADAMDEIFDSAVLLEAFSFRSVDISARVPRQDASPLRVFANDGRLDLFLTGNAALTDVRIVDATGHVVGAFTFSGDRASIGIDHLAAGAYAVVVNGPDKRIVGRFVKP